MDQTMFLDELLAVKNRVSEMASTFNRSPRPRHPPSHDLFSDHLEDVKARLQAMQTSLGLLLAGQSQMSSPPTAAPYHNVHPSALAHMPSMPSALPSGPLFWQLFNSLRVDVRGLGERVSAVERDVSDLEDRLDGTRVDRFTPPGSDDMCSTMSTHRDYFGQKQVEEACARSPTYSRAFSHQQTQHDVRNSHSDTPMHGKHGAAVCPAPEGVAFRDREIIALEDRVKDLQEDLRCSEDLVVARNDTIADLYQRLRGCNNVIAHHNNEQNKYRALIDSHEDAMQTLATAMTDNHDHAMQELSLEFRQKNQELERHIHHLRRSLHEISVSKQDEMNEMLAEKAQALHRLRETAERNDSIITQQQEILSRGAAIMEARDAEIDHLTRELRAAQRVDRNQQTEQEACAKMLIERLTREISSLQSSYRAEQRAHEHCAKLLADKSDEALKWSQALTKSETNELRGREERKQCARLLAEKTEEATELKKALTKALMPQLAKVGRATKHQGADQAQSRDQSLVSPFATPLGRMPSSVQWSPQPLPQPCMLPDEVRRANIWKAGNPVAEDNPSFGKQRQANSPIREHANRATRRNVLKPLEKLQIAEEVQGRSSSALHHHSSQQSIRTTESAGQQTSSARKASSMADMRSYDGNRLGQRETDPRQQRGHDTKRKSRLQAYVEAEESSCAEG